MTREQWIRRKAAFALGVTVKIVRGACIVAAIYVASLAVIAIWLANLNARFSD